MLINQNKPDGRLKTTKLINELINTKKASQQKFLLPAIWDEIGQKQYVERTANEMNIGIEEQATNIKKNPINIIFLKRITF